jgi:hypothetical protein
MSSTAYSPRQARSSASRSLSRQNRSSFLTAVTSRSSQRNTDRLQSTSSESSRTPGGSCRIVRASTIPGVVPPPTWTRSSRAPSRTTFPAHEVRTHHQPQHRQGSRPDDPAVAPAAGGSGDRVATPPSQPAGQSGRSVRTFYTPGECPKEEDRKCHAPLG